MGLTKTANDHLRESLIKWNQAATAIQSVSQSISQVTAALTELTRANSTQVEVETKLATNMRNTMQATEAQVKAVKDLCAEQQRLGVIGDEVQLAGAQELAIHTKELSTLKMLIPAMNDLAAKQDGLNVTASTTTSVAQMLGKAMEGNFTALQRQGIILTDAQKNILKYGDEAQRAATLVAAIEQRVGGMNAELAKTDAGKAKQVANALGDIKEQIGSMLAPMESAIVKVGQLAFAFSSIATAGTGLRGVALLIASVAQKINISKVATIAQASASKIAAAAQALWTTQLRLAEKANIAFAFGAKRAAVQAVALRWAMLGLMAASGIGLAIAAISAILSLFSDNVDEANDKMSVSKKRAEELKEEQDELNRTYAEVKGSLDIYIGRLKDLIDRKKNGEDVSKDEKKIIGELNGAYGETMGYFTSIVGWYQALIANSKAYCDQMVDEARIRILANRIAQREVENADIVREYKAGKYSEERPIIGAYWDKEVDPTTGQYLPTPKVVKGLSEKQKKVLELVHNKKANEEDRAEMEQLQSKSHQMPVMGSQTSPAGDTPTARGGGKNGETKKELIENAATYKDLVNNVAYYQQELEAANIADEGGIMRLARLKAEAEKAVEAFRSLADSANVPSSPRTLEEYDKVLSDLNKKRSKATAEEIADIDKQIAATKKARQALEDKALPPLKEAKTQEQLNEQLAYYNRLLQDGKTPQKVAAADAIKNIKKQQKAMTDLANSLLLTTSTGTLSDIDEQIQFYTQHQQQEDATHVAKTQEKINELTKKRGKIEFVIELQNMKEAAATVEKLTGARRKKAIGDLGYDELESRIDELQDKLAEGGFAEGQRKEIEALIETYRSWQREALKSVDTVKAAWSGVKSIGSGIEGITSALEGNKDAWSALTGMVDGFLQMYEGIMAVVEIIKKITEATKGATAAKAVENAVTEAGTAATTADTAATRGNTVATEAEATADAKDAGAKVTKEGAKLPFPANIAAIAAGIAAVVAALAMVSGFATGGIVGGTSYEGDNVLARVNSGEMILNKRQQARLFSLLDGRLGYRGNSSARAASVSLNVDGLRNSIGSRGNKVQFELKGRKLVGVMANETRISSRSGKRSNIVI
ncbi:MAG: hypothetical protein IJS19_09045 [Muribaculaceae bacterium]|nr:hypothetical protein [Muribaculaceae bacterium]